MQYLDAISKTTEWSLFVSKANHSNITVIQVYAPRNNAEEAEVEWFYDSTRPSRNYDDVITQLKPNILECEVKWALGSITTNKASGGDGIPVDCFKS